MLNEAKGNMYPFVTHTWNTVKGECPHGCSYCYMKRFGKQAPLHFDEKELKTDLGAGKFIFVGSSCDMFAVEVEYEWVRKTLQHCCLFDNQYFFQSKNPGAWIEWQDIQMLLPFDALLATTIETNRVYPAMGNAPAPQLRAESMSVLAARGWATMVTIEPIMDFDLESLVNIIRKCGALQINIGADSQGNGLPEPPAAKIRRLIEVLEISEKVKIKSNLKRITG